MSLLIEALKQAEARKGPKGGKPDGTPPAADAGAKAGSSGEAAGTAAEPTPTPAAPAGEGLSLSLEPREEHAAARPDPSPPAAAEQTASLNEPASGAAAPAAPPEPTPPAAADPAPASAVAPAPATAAGPTPTPTSADTPKPAPPAPQPGSPPPPRAAAPPAGQGRLQTGSEASRRTAREVMAASRPGAGSPGSRWRVLLGALVVVALLLSAGMWWLTRQTGSGIAPQLGNVPPVSDEVLAEAELGSAAALPEDGASATGAADATEPAVPPTTMAPAERGVVQDRGATATLTTSTDGPPDAVTGAATSAPEPSSAAARAALISAPAQELRPAPTLRIERARQAQQPLLSAYAALNRGELPAARRDYLRALQLHPDHPDALLGLAVIAEREGDLASAARRYREVLRVDPRNPTALSALLGSGQSSAGTRSESQLREALAAQPRSAALHFALGNLMAAANRWDEAQQAYFDAAVLAPDDPDVVFNLGVALDRLHKPRLALDHYLRAEELRRARPANYDPRALAQRITTLSQQLARGGDGTR